MQHGNLEAFGSPFVYLGFPLSARVPHGCRPSGRHLNSVLPGLLDSSREAVSSRPRDSSCSCFPLSRHRCIAPVLSTPSSAPAPPVARCDLNPCSPLISFISWIGSLSKSKSLLGATGQHWSVNVPNNKTVRYRTSRKRGAAWSLCVCVCVCVCMCGRANLESSSRLQVFDWALRSHDAEATQAIGQPR